MSKFLDDAQNPEFQRILEHAFRELTTENEGKWSFGVSPKLIASIGGESIQSLLGSLSASATDESDVDVGVARTLQVQFMSNPDRPPA